MKYAVLFFLAASSCAFAQDTVRTNVLYQTSGAGVVTAGRRKGVRCTSSGRSLFRHNHQRIGTDAGGRQSYYSEQQRDHRARLRGANPPGRSVTNDWQSICHQRSAHRVHHGSRGADFIYLELDG